MRPQSGAGPGPQGRNEDAPAPAITAATLLERGDGEFVRLAYKAVLGREVDDNGLAHYVGQLRTGADKGEILVELARSLEGRRRQIDLPGLDTLIGLSQQRTPSRWARLVRRIMRPFRAPPESLERGWRIVDNHLHRIDAALAEQASEIGALRAEIASLSARLESSSPATPAAATQAPSGPVRLVPPRAHAVLEGLRRAQSLRFAAQRG